MMEHNISSRFPLSVGRPPLASIMTFPSTSLALENSSNRPVGFWEDWKTLKIPRQAGLLPDSMAASIPWSLRGNFTTVPRTVFAQQTSCLAGMSPITSTTTSRMRIRSMTMTSFWKEAIAKVDLCLGLLILSTFH